MTSYFVSPDGHWPGRVIVWVFLRFEVIAGPIMWITLVNLFDTIMWPIVAISVQSPAISVPLISASCLGAKGGASDCELSQISQDIFRFLSLFLCKNRSKCNWPFFVVNSRALFQRNNIHIETSAIVWPPRKSALNCVWRREVVPIFILLFCVCLACRCVEPYYMNRTERIEVHFRFCVGMRVVAIYMRAHGAHWEEGDDTALH